VTRNAVHALAKRPAIEQLFGLGTAKPVTVFMLTLRGERLSGPVYAESKGFYFWLPSYARLRRSAPPQAAGISVA
jgi:hypothetical protein